MTEKKFLYLLIIFLIGAIGFTYIQKKHPEILKPTIQKQSNDWLKSDPGWREPPIQLSPPAQPQQPVQPQQPYIQPQQPVQPQQPYIQPQQPQQQ